MAAVQSPARTSAPRSRARGREWVVLPSQDEDVLLLRPLGGTDARATGIYLPLEGNDVSDATFAPPDPATAGDTSRRVCCAMPCGSISAPGPGRSARWAASPSNPRLPARAAADGAEADPVRLLIADDVGIGKTIEALLIARELLDRGEIARMAVLCPPHLCDQWQAEMREKFHIEPSVVRARHRGAAGARAADGAIALRRAPVRRRLDRLHQERPAARGVRARLPRVRDRRRGAHRAPQARRRGGRHQRHELLRAGSDPNRHLILTTATPH